MTPLSAKPPLLLSMACAILIMWTSDASVLAAQAPRTPYLQSGTPTSMVVVWRTSTSEDSVVCYGSDPDHLDRRATGPSGTQHEVRVTGLSPDTRYHYAVGTGSCPPSSAGEPGRYFVTAPPTGTDHPFRFWLVGDSGTGDSRQAAVRDAMLGAVGTELPDIFVHVGDMAYVDGTTHEFDRNFYAAYSDILQNTVCWPTLGNHEGHTSDSATQSGPYYEGYVLPSDGSAGGLPSGTEAYYAFDYANVHFVVLDSHQSDRSTGGAMLRWLEMDLASTDQRWIIAYWHHPPYSKGTHDSDAEGRLVDMRENALPILEAAGVDVVLTGHSHIYERSHLVHGAYDTPTTAGGHIRDTGDGRVDGDGPYDVSGDGALYVVAGHGGATLGRSADHPLMYFSEVQHGSCLVDVAGDALTLRNIRHDGTETDHVTLVKTDELILLSPVGGEEVLAGSTLDITWTGAEDADDVRVEYSLDGGTSWQLIIDRTANDGHHAWETPLRRTSAGRVRVSDADDTGRSAESLVSFSLTDRASILVIPMGSVWRYHDRGVDLGTSWLTETGRWPAGHAQLGYGDGDESTVLRDESPNIPSVYFRMPLDLSQEVRSADLRVLFDDGAVVWVNGTQVWSANVEDGTGYEVWATTNSEENQTDSVHLDFGSSSPFVVGRNVIAVMVKQVSDTSSDLSFDLSMAVDVSVDIPPEMDAGVAADGGAAADGGSAGGDGASGGDAGHPGGEDPSCGCAAPGQANHEDRPIAPLMLLAGIVVVWRRRIQNR